MSRLDKFGWEEIREERGRVAEYYLCWKHIVKESTLLGCFVWIKDADYLSILLFKGLPLFGFLIF